MQLPISKPETLATARLPCRGCMPQCPNYASCEGKLWRTGVQPPQLASGRSD